METHIVIPGAMAGAMILCKAFSALVPTRMVDPKPPPWQDVVEADRRTHPGPTYAFMPSPPIELDPDMPAGPGPAALDDQPHLADATTIRKAPGRAVYIAVNYDVPERAIASDATNRALARSRCNSRASSDFVPSIATAIVPRRPALEASLTKDKAGRTRWIWD
ncbi:MAG: hypothetical protein FJX31_02710 [Alphaproteobacteria bacterium]|nr:hypothetical protein [Alphaproteobacteria bacterium]